MGPLGSPLGPLGTPLGPPGDGPETLGGPRGPLRTMKTVIFSKHLQRQKLSIAAFEPFRCNASPQRLPVTVLCCICNRSGTLFDRPQSRTQGVPRFQVGADAAWRKEFTDRAPGPCSLLYIRYIYICIHIYVYVHVYIYISERFVFLEVSIVTRGGGRQGWGEVTRSLAGICDHI